MRGYKYNEWLFQETSSVIHAKVSKGCPWNYTLNDWPQFGQSEEPEVGDI